MKIAEIIFQNEYILSEIDLNYEFSGIATNLSDVQEGTILLLPESINEYNPTSNILPIAVICSRDAAVYEGIPTIRVDNIRIAMSKAYFRFNKLTNTRMKTIGITGTNGKTSTATFIKAILRDAGYKVGLIGTGIIEFDGERINDKNYSMTTPDPSLLYNIMKEMEKKGCEIIVMEISSHALALHKVEPIDFDYAIFTNLSSEHLDFHKTVEEYYLAKKSLFSKTKVGLFNIDDEYARRAYQDCKSERLAVGALWKGDVWVKSLKNNGLSGISYIYNHKDFSFKLNLKTPGTYNVYNSMLAAALCIHMGCKPCQVKASLEKIDGIAGRFEIIKDDITVIIDYAHTYAAFYNIMKNLNDIKKNNKLTVVFGCGGERDREKRPRMASVAEKFADKIIVTTDNSRGEDPKEIIGDIIRGFNQKSFIVNENREGAITDAILDAEANDIVAIIGKGNERYIIDKNGCHDFDERTIIKSALKKRNENKA